MASSTMVRVVLAGLALLLPAAACGGDEDAAGTDASFTAELCEAMNETNADLVRLEKEATAMDFEQMAKRVSEILDDLADALAGASPPQDMAAWNRDAVKTIRGAADSLTRTQRSSSLDVLGDSPLPDPPSGIRTRIEAAARESPACRGLTLFGE